MADNKKSWSREETFSLISHWELYPELWDVKSKDHKNRIKKQKALKSIATVFSPCENEITRKLHNLRTQFHSEIRKIKSKHSGDGTEDKYESSWDFFGAMNFIQADYSNKQTLDNLEIAEKVNDSENPETILNINENPDNMKKKSVKRKNNSRLKEDDLLSKAMKIIDKPADEFQIFGNFVACELRNIEGRENQQRLKRMIEVAEQCAKNYHSGSGSELSRPPSTASYYSSFISSPSVEDSQKVLHSTQGLYEQSYRLVSETDTSMIDTNHPQIL